MYRYNEMRPKLFSATGMDLVLKIHHNAFALSKSGRRFSAEELMRHCGGDSWLMLAAIDYLTERGYLRCVTPAKAQPHVPRQDWDYQLNGV